MPKDIILLEDVVNMDGVTWPKGGRHWMLDEVADPLLKEKKAELYKPGKKKKKISEPFNK